MHCQWGRKNQTCPLPFGLRHPAGGGPSHGDMRQKFGKDRMCGSGDMLADKPTHTHRQRHTHRRAHYNSFATAPEGKVTNNTKNQSLLWSYGLEMERASS